jgi:hypothetical protein
MLRYGISNFVLVLRETVLVIAKFSEALNFLPDEVERQEMLATVKSVNPSGDLTK